MLCVPCTRWKSKLSQYKLSKGNTKEYKKRNLGNDVKGEKIINVPSKLLVVPMEQETLVSEIMQNTNNLNKGKQ